MWATCDPTTTSLHGSHEVRSVAGCCGELQASSTRAASARATCVGAYRLEARLGFSRLTGEQCASGPSPVSVTRSVFVARACHHHGRTSSALAPASGDAGARAYDGATDG